MNNRKGEFAFGQILAAPLVGGVDGRMEVLIVIKNLEKQADGVDQRYTVSIEA